MKQDFDPELFDLLCKKYKDTLKARKKHDQIKNSIMNKQIKLRGLLLCIGVTIALTLLFTRAYKGKKEYSTLKRL